MSSLATLERLRTQADAATRDADATHTGVKDLLRPAVPAAPASLAIASTLEKSKGITGGFTSFGQFAHAVRAKSLPGNYGPDLGGRFKNMLGQWENEFAVRQKEWAVTTKANSPLGMNESFTLEDGGVLIPPEFVAQVLMRTYTNDLLARTTVFPIGGNSIQIPAINETSRADGSRFGGVAAYWRREAGSVSETKPNMMDIKLELNSLMLRIRTTEELLTDTGGALELFLTTVAAQELTFKVGDSIVNGDGNGKPLGITKSAAKVTQAKETNQPASTLVAANVIKMWSRLHVSARPSAVWLYDQTIEPQLMQMTIGTAGSQLVVWLPPGGLSGSQYATLLGRPMIPVEFCQQLGTEGDLILWDPTSYLTATKGGIQTAVSMHLYFDTNEMAFRFILRMDGKNWWINSLTPKSGGPNQSNTVTLATRS